MRNIQNIDIFFQNNIDILNQKIINYLHSLSDDVTVNVENIAKTISNYYRSEMMAISVRTQILYEDKSFFDNQEYPSFEDFQQKYPELMRIIQVKRDNILSLVKTTIKRFIQDKSDLEEAGLPAGNYINDFIISDGDSHRRGQRVCFLKTDLGKLVYKPRSMQIDDAVFRAAFIINKNVAEDIAINIPKAVNYDLYGWQEFIEYSPAENRNDLSTYYRSLGALTAFFVGFGGHDMHYENLTISHNKAVPLDLETAFGTQRQAQRLKDLTGLIKMTNFSAALAGVGTLILPPLARSERFDIDISPITDGVPQKSKTMKGLSVEEKENGNGIEASMKNALVTKLSPYKGPLKLDRVHPRLYVEDFHQGYKEMTYALISHTNELVEFFDKEISHIPNRCVIRPTATYAAFLDTSYHPKYLTSKQERDKLFMRLGPPPGVPTEVGEQALLVEREALLEGDIPYFTDEMLADYLQETQSGKKELNGFSVDPKTPLRQLGSIQDKVIRYLQHGAFAGLDAEVWKTREDGDITPFFNIDLEESWKDALYNLKSQAQDLILYDDQKNLATMFIQVVGGDNRVQTVPLNATYYEGQGTLFLLAGELWPDESSPESDVLKALLQGLLEPVSHIPGEPISGFIGGFSRLRLLDLVHRYMGDKSADNLVDELIGHAIQETNKLGSTGDSDLNIDYVTGLSSALALLGTLGPFLTERAAFLRDRIHSMVSACLAEDQLQDISGIAHGPLGLMLGLVAGGKTLESHELRDLRARLRQQVKVELESAKKQPPAIRQAWCSGIPGIAETFARVLEATGGLEDRDRKFLFELFEELKLDIASLNGPVDISLCHGIAGAFSAWCRIARYILEPQILKDIKEEITHLRARLHDGELEIRGGTRHATSSLGTMLGMSGAILAFAYMESGRDLTDLFIL